VSCESHQAQSCDADPDPLGTFVSGHHDFISSDQRPHARLARQDASGLQVMIATAVPKEKRQAIAVPDRCVEQNLSSLRHNVSSF
jgi:hypothetical protein